MNAVIVNTDSAIEDPILLNEDGAFYLPELPVVPYPTAYVVGDSLVNH